jgi:S-adenosylmethionine-dependent methyltransferase
MNAYHELAADYDEKFYNGYRERIQDGITFNILNKLLPQGHNKILDAGGGTGFYSLPLASMGHNVTILDISREMLEVAEGKAEKMGLADRVRIVQCNMEEMALKSSEFDLVICHLALCHVLEPLRALKEFRRVLKDDGLLSLVVGNKLFFSLAEAYKGNLRLALERLKMRELYIDLNGLGRLRTFDRDEVLSLLCEAEFIPLRVMGLRILSDYLMYSKGSEPRDLESLKGIEELLSETDLVNGVGRFHFIISRARVRVRR